jgi:hypothetical protein
MSDFLKIKLPPVSAADWDAVRLRFSSSIMVETPIASLSQNVGLGMWPIKGKDETPAKYIDLPFDELASIVAFKKKPERMALLVEVLRETLAFDQPFAEMVKQVEADVSADDRVLWSLNRLEIPAEFPLELSALSEETRAFCKDEGLTTIGQFAGCSQRIAGTIIVGGDFRALLNALAHLDEKAICAILPFRPGSKGLHLPEALSLMIRSLSPAEREVLEVAPEACFSPSEAAKVRSVGPEEASKISSRLRDRAQAIFGWFRSDAENLAEEVRRGTTSLDRYFLPLGNPEDERLAALVFCRQFGVRSEARPAAGERGSSGLFGRVAQIFNRG